MPLIKRLGPVIIMILCMGRIATAQTGSLAIEDVDSLMRIEKKPLLVLLSAEWCKYCQMQKSQLCKNKVFTKKAESFYYVVFNAESKEDISFNRQTYRYKPAGVSNGIHELATALNGSEQVAFPTWVLLGKDYRMLFKYDGLLTRQQMGELLKAIEKVVGEPGRPDVRR